MDSFCALIVSPTEQCGELQPLIGKRLARDAANALEFAWCEINPCGSIRFGSYKLWGGPVFMLGACWEPFPIFCGAQERFSKTR